MGFLEESANEIAAREKAEQAKREERQLELRKQSAHKAQEPNEVRRLLALRYRQDSGIGLLVKRLGEILASDKVEVDYTGWVNSNDLWSHVVSLKRSDYYNTSRPCRDFFPRGVSRGSDYEIVASDNKDIVNPLEYPNINPEDIDSAIDIAIWDPEYAGKGWSPPMEYNAFRIKYLVVESRPDGSIAFGGNDTKSIAKEVWKSQPDILEASLGRAYKYHRVHTFGRDYKKDLRRYYGLDKPPSYSPYGRGPWS